MSNPEIILHDNKPQPMRTETEIYYAHDMLAGILLKEIPVQIDPESLRILHIIASTLCWVLRHDHNPEVGELLKVVESDLAKAGHVLHRHDN